MVTIFLVENDDWASEASPTLGCSNKTLCDIIGERVRYYGTWNFSFNSIPRRLPIGNSTGYFTRYIEIVREICNSTARVK